MRNREVVVDTFNVIDTFVKLGLTYEEMFELGFTVANEPELKMTPALLAVWYMEEKQSRQLTRKRA